MRSPSSRAAAPTRSTALLFPHTCDSIQGLATVVPDFGPWSKPVFHYIHARGEGRPSARRFVEAELRRLAAELAAFAGRDLDLDRLRDAIRLHREIDRLRAALLDERARLPLGDRELYRLLRRGEYLWPADHLAELEAAAAGLAPAPVQRGLPVLVSGIVPEPMSVLDALAAAGAFVAADDYAAIGRRVNRHHPAALDDPFAALVELSFAAPPCSTRQSNQIARADHLEALLETSGARGLLLHDVKFCEPELFDLPHAAPTPRGARLPVLHVEFELETELSGQTLNRIEAFVEMLRPAGGGHDDPRRRLRLVGRAVGPLWPPARKRASAHPRRGRDPGGPFGAAAARQRAA